MNRRGTSHHVNIQALLLATALGSVPLAPFLGRGGGCQFGQGAFCTLTLSMFQELTR